MYALYRKSKPNGSAEHYEFEKEISLFGCNSGWIPWLLRKQLETSDSEPYMWHLNVAEALAEADYAGRTLIINLKPNSKRPNLSLYEIADVWGYSDSGWTPVMLHLRGLFIDDDPGEFNDRRFSRKVAEIDEPIFSMLYMSGSVSQGELTGKWTAPPSSLTNSVLLWPETLDYFMGRANEVLGRSA